MKRLTGSLYSWKVHSIDFIAHARKYKWKLPPMEVPIDLRVLTVRTLVISEYAINRNANSLYVVYRIFGL